MAVTPAPVPRPRPRLVQARLPAGAALVARAAHVLLEQKSRP